MDAIRKIKHSESDAMADAVMEHLGPLALTHGHISPIDAFELGWNARAQTLASKDAEIAAMEAEIAVLRESRKFLSNMHHDIIVAMQAAWIEWQRVGDADTAMFWIQNTLAGPGLIPGEDEPYASEPQAYFDKNKSEPFPECFCGRPSNQLWMGQGFCSQAHYAEARAALTTQPKE